MTVKPAFRKPWTSGAHAYHEADTFAAAREGFKRVRTVKMFHMSNSGEAGQAVCVTCKVKLADEYKINGDTPGFAHTATDTWSTWYYLPTKKEIVGGQHYYCSWTTLLTKLLSR